MIKKLTLASVATFALLMIPAQAEGNKCQAGKCGAGMMEKSKSCKGKSCDKGKSCKKMKKKGHGSAYLIPLPSPMRMLMKYEDDPKLALSAEQKTKLEAIRNDVMPKMMKLKGEIAAQTKALKTSCRAGTKPTSLKADVEKIAQLKIEATMVKLSCIERTKEVLDDKQETFIKELRKSNKKSRMQNKSIKKQMKCQAGKCGAK
jgi:hypothetical protein